MWKLVWTSEHRIILGPSLILIDDRQGQTNQTRRNRNQSEREKEEIDWQICISELKWTGLLVKDLCFVHPHLLNTEMNVESRFDRRCWKSWFHHAVSQTLSISLWICVNFGRSSFRMYWRFSEEYAFLSFHVYRDFVLPCRVYFSYFCRTSPFEDYHLH